ncbi:hypothetical protein [Leptolyngbya sp. NM2-A1]|uniref:hypothetical protein n=1 Tax=unclassified Leptolyngbya TaxID=2650499 RepID=UPI00329A5620
MQAAKTGHAVLLYVYSEWIAYVKTRHRGLIVAPGNSEEIHLLAYGKTVNQRFNGAQIPVWITASIFPHPVRIGGKGRR